MIVDQSKKPRVYRDQKSPKAGGLRAGSPTLVEKRRELVSSMRLRGATLVEIQEMLTRAMHPTRAGQSQVNRQKEGGYPPLFLYQFEETDRRE